MTEIKNCRITIDVPKEKHKKLKAMALVLDKSMREMILEAIETFLNNKKSFNEKTLKIMESFEDEAPTKK